MYYNISSMQDTSKLLQCTQAHAHRNGEFISKSRLLFASFPREAALPPPQQRDRRHLGVAAGGAGSLHLAQP